MVGAGAVIGLVVKETDVAEAMANDLAFYYSYTELPSFTPAKVLKAELSERYGHCRYSGLSYFSWTLDAGGGRIIPQRRKG